MLNSFSTCISKGPWIKTIQKMALTLIRIRLSSTLVIWVNIMLYILIKNKKRGKQKRILSAVVMESGCSS